MGFTKIQDSNDATSMTLLPNKVFESFVTVKRAVKRNSLDKDFLKKKQAVVMRVLEDAVEQQETEETEGSGYDAVDIDYDSAEEKDTASVPAVDNFLSKQLGGRSMRRGKSFDVTEQYQGDSMDRSEPVRPVSSTEKVSPSQRRRRSSHREGRRSMSRGDKQATKTAQAKGEEEDVLPKISTPNPAMRSCRRAGRRSSLHGQTVAWVPSTGYETPQGQRTRRNISSNQRKLTQSPRLSTTNSTTINASASVTPSAVDYSRGMISPAIEHQRRCRKSFRRSISYGDAEMASSSIICSDNHTTKRLAPRSKSGDENMMCASLQRRSIRRARSMEEEDMNGSSFLGNSSIRRGSRTSKSANSLLDM